VLARGKLEEKLQLIVRETGTEHADRIEIVTDPEVLTAFQRRVLPLVNKSCARSGCHGGRTARLFRFPISAATGDAHLYASFVLLDQMQARHGPLIDRTNPEESALLSYLLPQENNEHAHPPVKHGAPFKSGLRSKTDPQYEAIVDWINALRYPHPDYGLEYQNPYRQPAPPTSKPAEEAAAEGPGLADKPASRPATRPQSAPSRPARP